MTSFLETTIMDVTGASQTTLTAIYFGPNFGKKLTLRESLYAF